MPAKLQLLAVLAFAVAMLFIENQIQRLEDSRSRLGEKCGCFRNFKIKSNTFFLSSTLILMFKLGGGGEAQNSQASHLCALQFLQLGVFLELSGHKVKTYEMYILLMFP